MRRSVENWNQCSKLNCEAFRITSMHHQTLEIKKIIKIITKNNNNKYYSVTSIKELQHTENRTGRRDPR